MHGKQMTIKEAYEHFFSYRIYVNRYNAIIEDMAPRSSDDNFNVTFVDGTYGLSIISENEMVTLMK